MQVANGVLNGSAGDREAELLAMIAQLQAKNDALAARANAKISLKVTEKGGVSMYGLGRYPVTLYASQWERLIASGEAVKAFIRENSAIVSRKD